MTIQPLGETPVARWVGMLAPARQLAEVLAQTEFVPTAFRGQPDAIAAAILYGDELGISPMQALGSIYVVEGKPGPSSELARALILGAGHSLAIHEMSGTRARVSGLRKDRPEAERVTVEWTMDMARAAGLTNRPPWRAYPRAMLLARAFGDLARIVFPDVLKGLSYVAEDADTAADLEAWGGTTDGATDDQPAVATRKPRKAIQRATKPAGSPEPTPVPVAPDMADEPPRRPPHHHDFGPDGRCSGCSAVDPRRRQEPPPPGNIPAGTNPSPQAVGPGPDDQPLPDDMQPTGTGQPIRPDPADLPPEHPRPGPIGSGMVQAINIMLTGELGSAATRDERLAMLSAILGRKVESSKTMTVAEGHLVRDWFGKLERNEVAYDMDPEDGSIMIRDPA